MSNVIDRACRLRTLLADETLRRLIGGITKLPSLPAVYHQLMAAMARPDVSMRSICDIVEQDTAMCAKILQLVNSACFGNARHIARIDRAVSYLGMELIKNLALTVHVFSVTRLPSISRFSFDEEQRHAILTARVASRMFTDTQQSQYAFTASLLHDIGKLVLAISLPQGFAEATALHKTGGRADYLAEIDVLGVSHAHVGAYLLGLWGLPYPIVEAVAHHHHPSAAAERVFDLPSATWLADLLIDRELGLAREVDMHQLETLNVASHLRVWSALAHEEVHDRR